MIQAEYDNAQVSLQEASVASRKKTSQKGQVRAPKKFNLTEVMAIQLMFKCAAIRLDHSLQLHKFKKLKQDQAIANQMAVHFSSSNTLKGLMREMNKALSEFLRFQDINVMFLDPEKT